MVNLQQKRKRGRISFTSPVPHVDPAADWARHTEYRIEGRALLTPGTEFSVRGERGRFRFVYATEKLDGTVWLDGIGGTKHESAWRSFHPERIKRVHRIEKRRMGYDG